MIVQGIDSNSISRPLLLAADGSVILRATDLTTTGGKLRIDASGNLYVASMRPHAIYGETGVTQVVKNGLAQNVYVDLYTVTAGKTLYITCIEHNITNLTANAWSAFVDIRDATPAVQYQFRIGSPGNSGNNISIPIYPPLMVASGWRVSLISQAANVYSIATFIGYEL